MGTHREEAVAVRRAREFRVLCTDDVLEMSRVAEERGYNRQLAPEFTERLDPAGAHVVFLELVHDEVDGEHRYCMLAKVKGSMEPVDVQLDVAPELTDRGYMSSTSRENERRG